MIVKEGKRKKGNNYTFLKKERRDDSNVLGWQSKQFKMTFIRHRFEG